MTEAKQTTSIVLLTMIYQLFISAVWGFAPWVSQMPIPLQLVLTQILAFIVPIVFFFFITKKPVRATLRLYPIHWKNVILIVLMSLLIQPLMGLLSFLASLLFPNSVAEIISQSSELSTVSIMIISVGVMPAICEELFFRGVVFSGYRFVPTVKACLVTGLLFGIIHMDVQQFLYTFALGSLFCALVYHTNSILASIIAHFTINASQVLLAFSQMKNAETIAELPELTVTQQFVSIGTITLLSLPLLAGCIWLFYKRNANPIQKDIVFDEEMVAQESKIGRIPFALIILIYIVVAVVLPFTS
jgi:membrane protease YdiL (CAAX protease family)